MSTTITSPKRGRVAKEVKKKKRGDVGKKREKKKKKREEKNRITPVKKRTEKVEAAQNRGGSNFSMTRAHQMPRPLTKKIVRTNSWCTGSQVNSWKAPWVAYKRGL